MADRSVSVKLRMEVADFLAKANQARKSVAGFQDEMRRSKDAARDMSDGLLAAGGMMTGAFLLTVKPAADFEKQMSHVKAATKGTAAEMDQLRTAALAAGADTVFSATQAAKAQEELAKAGLSTSDILSGALRGALDLAAAGNLDLAQAADIAAKAMSQFGLRGKDVGHIADMLAGGANATATDVQEMGEALKMGGGAAHAMGLTLDDTVVTLGASTKGALVGSDAGTSLKTMLMMLANPSKKAAELMRELGINAFDVHGEFVGVYNLADQLRLKLGTLTQEQRMSALATIFGADAMRAANVLYEQGSDGLVRLAEQISAQADAAGTAATKTDNLVGDLERLKGSLETLAIGAGSGSAGGLRTLVQGLDNVVGSLQMIPAGMQSFAVGATGVVGATALMAGAVMKGKEKVDDLLTSMSEMGPRGERAAKGMAAATRGLATFAILVTAMQAGSAVLGTQVNPKVEALSKDLIEFGRSGKFAGEGVRMFGKDLANLEYDLATLDRSGGAKFGNWLAGAIEGITGTGSMFDQSMFHAKERIGGLDAALANLVQQGRMQEAQAAFDKLAELAKKNGTNVNELKDGLPQYAAALAGATSEQTKAIEVTDRNGVAALLLRSSLAEAITALGSFTAAYDRLNGAAVNFAEAEIAVEAAVDSFVEKVKESKGSLDVHNEAGRQAKQAMLDVAAAAADAAQAKYDETGSLKVASDTYNQYIGQLRAAMRAAGMNAAEIERLLGLYAAMPPLKETTVIQNMIIRRKEIIERTGMEPGRGNSKLAPAADGGVFQFYASGGARENHVAQIAPAGTWRVWAEDETGGEAYIPLAAAKRARSLDILADVNRRFGKPLTAGTTVFSPTITIPIQAAPGMDERMVAGIVRQEVGAELGRVARQLNSGTRI